MFVGKQRPVSVAIIGNDRIELLIDSPLPRQGGVLRSNRLRIDGNETIRAAERRDLGTNRNQDVRQDVAAHCLILINTDPHALQRVRPERIAIAREMGRNDVMGLRQG